MNELQLGTILKISLKTDKAMNFFIFPLTPKISLVIHLNICHMVLLMLVWRILVLDQHIIH